MEENKDRWMDVLLLFAIVISLFAVFMLGRWSVELTEDAPEPDIEYRTDTIRITEPVATSTTSLGYDMVSVPLEWIKVKPKMANLGTQIDSSFLNIYYRNTAIDAALDSLIEANVDSVAIELPREQTRYEDSTYTAWVSGFHARLDSIYVRERSEIVRIREPPRKWHIGLQGGYGMSREGMSPFVGIGITYSLISF